MFLFFFIDPLLCILTIVYSENRYTGIR